jgi:hypothetical protein
LPGGFIGRFFFGENAMTTFLLIVAVIISYFIPTIISVQDKKKNKTAIITLNVLAGWTFIGWVIALVWAVTKDKP